MSASQLPGSSLKPIPDPEHRQSIEDVIAEIQTQDWYADQIVYNTVFEPRSAQIGVCWSTHCPQTIRCIPVFIHSDLGSAAFGNYRAGSSRLKEDHVVLHSSGCRHRCTGPGEGCHCFHEYSLREEYHLPGWISHTWISCDNLTLTGLQVPVLQRLEEDPNATAMFIYPTKVVFTPVSSQCVLTFLSQSRQALAQDQKAALEQLLVACPGLENTNVSGRYFPAHAND